MKAASRASPSSSWPMRARPCPSPRCLPLHPPLPLPRSPTRHLGSTNRENRWVARRHLHLCRCTFFSNRYYSHTYLTYVHALYLEHTHPLSLSLSCITRVAPHCVNTLMILHVAHSKFLRPRAEGGGSLGLISLLVLLLEWHPTVSTR